MTKNNEDEDGDLDNKKRKEIKDFAIWFNRTEKQNQEKRKKDLKRKRELEQVCNNPKPKILTHQTKKTNLKTNLIS